MKKISDILLFRAFSSRNYSLYFVGRAVSQFGTWMQRIAVLWVIYAMTHSAFLLGVTVFAEQFPSFICSIPGGVIADRYDRFTVIKVTQVASMVQSLLLALLVYSGHPPIWAILALSVLLGVINAIDIPARQTLLHQVVTDQADLPNALALTTATASLAQLLGPALSGIVLNAWGAAACFLINAASFGGVILSVVLMKRPAPTPKKQTKNAWAEFKEGFQYIVKTPDLGTIILLLGLVSFLVLPYNTILPVFAKVVFKGDASTYGYINSFIAVGAVSGTIYLASRKPGAHMRRILLASLLMLGITLICFSQIKNFPLAMFFAALTGFGSIAQYTISNILVQSESAAPMRGRAIGVLFMAIFGMVPLGSLVVGSITARIGAPMTVLCEGIAALLILLLFSPALLNAGKHAPNAEPGAAVAEETPEVNSALHNAKQKS